MSALHDPDQLLARLEAAKNRFDRDQLSQLNRLLSQFVSISFDDPQQLLRLHESLLFLRAFPPAPSTIPRIERLLNDFHLRINALIASGVDMSVFDDFDTSGIAGTTMQDIVSLDVAQWLAQRIPRNIEIAWADYWDDYQGERSRGDTWPRFIPLLEEDADVEATIPWQQWLDFARGRQKPLPWILDQVLKLPLPPRHQAEIYDSLRLPIRWNLADLKLSRTRNFTRPRTFFFHHSLIQRSEVSLAQELSKPAPKLKKLPATAGHSAINSLREFMFVRYRDLYGATLGDPRTVVRVNVGRGAVIHLWGVPPDRRLPLRAYVCGYTLKNGVPINYFEAIGLCEWIEIGFNTFYTYRQGETAWIYAQILRCLQAFTGAKVFSIYPYQIGQQNDEAIDSGAFWFYRKLGFRPGRAALLKLCETQEKRIGANPKYRTPRRTLQRLAESPMFYEVDSAGSNTNAGLWDTFSVRTLALLVNRRMARDFNSDSEKIRKTSTLAVTRALNIKAQAWSPDEKQALENWSLVLALIPDLSRWTLTEKRHLIEIIRAKAAPSEISYFRQSQKHTRLRRALLSLGSRPNKA
jgi:hypothetical protein